MTLSDPESEAYLERARERIRLARRRQTAWFFLILGPFALAITILRALEPHEYPPGDLRNEPLFWGLVALLTLLFFGTLMTLAARRLRQGAGAGTTVDPDGAPRDIQRR